MNLRQNKTLLLLLSTVSFSYSACPHSSSQINSIPPPNDSQHQNIRRRRRLATLTSHPETRDAISDIISHRRRSLQSSSAFTCLSTATYNALKDDVAHIASNITDFGDRGHFLGGILRLAAHDFMDYDMTDETNPGGPDGCLDLTHANNAGLSDIWCDNDNDVNPVACPFKFLYDEVYSTVMSRADYWVAGANAAIAFSSLHRLDLPFQWGRVDRDVCAESSDRLPADTGCTAVEGVFLNRMGLSWTDAVALLGGHTLGRGDENFSGHPGTWVETAEESTVFDKAYYTELVNRPWRPREVAGGAVDWTWGGRQLSVMMLNADVCLYFDIPDGNEQNCCTNTERDCRGFFQDVQCNTTDIVRPEAKTAIDDFLRGGRDNNDAFFNAYTNAWVKATQLGNENNLNDLQPTCVPTSKPTGAPTVSTAPSDAPVTPLPTTECRDKISFLDRKGRKRDCAWALARDRCGKFAEECPVTCGVCDSFA
jgi:hypothetical protein